jgi:hypothetical protein
MRDVSNVILDTKSPAGLARPYYPLGMATSAMLPLCRRYDEAPKSI